MMRSLKSSEPFMTIIKSDLKRFWVLPLISTVILFLSGAFFLIVTKQGGYVAPFRDNDNIGFIFAYILLGAGSGLLSFNYMVNKKASNYAHSLPVTRGRLFTAHYIAGAVLIVIPPLINGLMMTAVMGSKFAGDYAVMSAVGILITLVIYSFTVLAAVVSGNLIMHIFCSAFFNGLVISVLLAGYSYMSILLFGYSMSERMEDLIKNSLVIFAFRNGVTVTILLSYIAVLIMISLMAYLIYRIRPVENTGQSLVFEGTKIILPVIVTVLGSALFGIFINAVLGAGNGISGALIIGIAAGFLISFVIISIIMEKSQKIFTRRNMISFSVSAIVIVLAIGLMGADVTGYGKRIPAAEDTESAGVRLFCDENDMGERLRAEYFRGTDQSVGKGFIRGDYDSLMMLKDEKNIKDSLAVQKIIRDRKNNILKTGSDDNNYQYAAAFTDKGKIIKRGYEAIDEGTEKKIRPHLKRIFESEEVKQVYRLSNLRYSIRSAEYSLNFGEDTKTVPREKTAELIAAMDKDFLDISYEKYAETGDGSAYEDQSDESDGKTITLELYDKNIKKRTQAYPDDAFVTYIIVNVNDGSKHTMRWLRNNLK